MSFETPRKRRKVEVEMSDDPTRKIQQVQKALVRKVNLLAKAQELKTFDTTFGVTQIDFDTNHSQNLGLVLQGDTRTTRDGSKLLATSIEIRGMIRQETTPSSFGAQFRLVITKSKQRFIPASNVSTTVSGVLENGGTLSAPNSPFERNNQSHYVVLVDKTWYVNGPTAGATGVNFHIRKKLNHVIEFDEASTTAEKGQIFATLYSNRSAASGDGPEVSFTSRLFFKDS